MLVAVISLVIVKMHFMILQLYTYIVKSYHYIKDGQ